MELTVDKAIGKVEAGQIRAYRKNPADLNLAACAGAYTAKKLNERVVIVEGNSYGCKVYHIAKESDDLTKYTVMKCKARVLIVEPTGECFYGIAQ
jgi:hypothetical protein